MATEYKTLQPHEFYKTFLDRKSRPDGRSLLEFRQTTLNAGSVSTADGSAVIKCGNTSVVCGIKAEVAAPERERPGHGFIVANVTLPPLCSSRIKSGPPGETAQTASQFMAELVASDSVLALDRLCIETAKWVWVLHADLVCLNLDGGLLDACVLALVAALSNLTLPAVKYDAELDKLTVDVDTRSPLGGVRRLVASTFAVFDNDIIISDPTDEEELLAAGSVTVTMDGDAVAHLYKPGGCCLDEKKMETLLKRSEQKTKHMSKLVDEACASSMQAER